MQLFLDAHDLLPTFHSTTDIYMVVIGETMRGAMRLADKLRAEGVNVELASLIENLINS